MIKKINEEEFMELKIDDIDKHDSIVRKKFPNAEMRKVGKSKLIWVTEYGRVASIDVLNNYINFEFEIKGKKKV